MTSAKLSHTSFDFVQDEVLTNYYLDGERSRSTIP